jgi:hypothetical protein
VLETAATRLSASHCQDEEKHEPVGDIDVAVAEGLKVLDLKRPIREADILTPHLHGIYAKIHVSRTSE